MSSTDSVKQFSIDFKQTCGEVRPLNGVNLGPLSMHGLLDFTPQHKRLQIPLTRLHDCPYAVAETVDIHHIFRHFDADPEDPAAYEFARTDAYVQSILDTGSQIVYRLGESIDHFRAKPYIVPPADPQKWARVCVNIIRHYNEGWANGFRHDIRYWEIWNEPHNPPCWSGTTEQYYQLYEIASKAIKAHAPSLKVGGPAMEGDEPYWSKRFDFIQYCVENQCPLDFFSWHIYTARPDEIVRRAHHVRELLDENGLTETESHLNEWNYLTGDSWGELLNGDPKIRGRSFETLEGAVGAAFTASVLIFMQDLPLDAANYYWAREGWWGLFDTYGRPTKNYYAMLAFAELRGFPIRVASQGNVPAEGVGICAAISPEQNTAAVLLTNMKCPQEQFEVELNHLPWSGAVICQPYLVNDTHELAAQPPISLTAGQKKVRLSLPPATVCLLKIKPREI
jgi:hypothetical protein